MSTTPSLLDLDGRPLSPADRLAVDALVRAATTSDAVAPLSEQSALALRHPSGPRHLLAHAGERLAGYAQLVDGAAELVVDPAHRRAGVGTGLLAALRTARPGVRVWAHGDLPSSTAFAAARGLTVVRELFVLERGLGPDRGDALPLGRLPEGLHARAFVPGRDEAELLRVNASAFAHHPEQGRLTRADLEERVREPWFDPTGLLLVCPDGDDTEVVAFHWTKVHPAGDEGPEAVGEVYVVAVDPAHQGRGLGRPVTLLGLHHLEQTGLGTVILYVDGDNPAALSVYRGLGFVTRSTDRMYACAGDLDSGTMTT